MIKTPFHGPQFGAAKKASPKKATPKNFGKAAPNKAKPKQNASQPADAKKSADAASVYTDIHFDAVGAFTPGEVKGYRENIKTYKTMLNQAGIAVPMATVRMNSRELIIELYRQSDIDQAVDLFKQAGHTVEEHRITGKPVVHSLPVAQTEVCSDDEDELIPSPTTFTRHTIVFETPAQAWLA